MTPTTPAAQGDPPLPPTDPILSPLPDSGKDETEPPRARGLLLVVSGPAGSGKGTVLRELLRDPAFAYSVSATTRAPRPGEVDGRDYYFLTREQFRAGIADDRFLESAEYCGNAYGTPRAPVERLRAAGRHVILEIEVKGALQVKEKEPDALLVMLVPPDAMTLEARLRGRGTESEEALRLRLAAARGELSRLREYDYLLRNETGAPERTAALVRTIVEAETRRTARLPGGVEGFLRDFYGEA